MRVLDREFDYNNYLVVSCDDHGFNSNIQRALNNISLTQEGQSTIQRAYDNNGGKRLEIRAGLLNGGVSGVMIDVDEAVEYINVSRASILTTRYLGEDGGMHDFSLERLLFHELSHKADESRPDHSDEKVRQARFDAHDQAFIEAVNEIASQEFASFSMAQRFVDYLDSSSESGDQDMVKDIYRHLGEKVSLMEYHWEDVAVNLTNAYMEKYYNEVPRADYGSTDREGTSEMEVHATIRPERPGL